MKLFFVSLFFLCGCSAVKGQIERETWDNQMLKGDISYHDRTDLLLHQNDMAETRVITVKSKRK